MKLVRYYAEEDQVRLGAVIDGRVLDLADAWAAHWQVAGAGLPLPASMEALLHSDEGTRQHLARIVEGAQEDGAGRPLTGSKVTFHWPLSLGRLLFWA